MKKIIVLAFLFASGISNAETTGLKLQCNMSDNTALAVFADGVSREDLTSSYTVGLYNKTGSAYSSTQQIGQCTGAIYISNNYGSRGISNARATMKCGTSVKLTYEFSPASSCNSEFGGCFYPETNVLKGTIDGRNVQGRCDII
jgi:spore maturation protein SpmB